MRSHYLFIFRPVSIACSEMFLVFKSMLYVDPSVDNLQGSKA